MDQTMSKVLSIPDHVCWGEKWGISANLTLVGWDYLYLTASLKTEEAAAISLKLAQGFSSRQGNMETPDFSHQENDLNNRQAVIQAVNIGI